MSFFRRIFNSPEEESKKKDAEEAAPKAETESTETTEATPAEAVPEAAPAEEPGPDDLSTRPVGIDRDDLPAAPVEDEDEPQSPIPTVADGVTRKLASETVISHTNTHLTFGQASDVGMVRSKNEDSVYSMFSTSRSVDNRPDFGIFIVADGMGGHSEGEKASSITVRVIARELINAVYIPILQAKALSELPPINDVLVDAVKKANETVHILIPKGGGTTCTAVTVLGDRMYIAHVGDSRAYLIQDDEIEKLTRDHSVSERFIEMGQMTREEAENHPRGNELYRALGFNDELEVDIMSRRIPQNSRLLMCSDGLWNLVRDDVAKQIINDAPTPQEACNKLVAMANENGGLDNITVLVLFR